MDDMRGGLQLYWVLTSAIVMLAAIGIANLYVQGGLELRQIAWFTLFLAVYDIIFTRVIPLTPELAVALQGRPLDPSVGFAAGSYNANVGLGDLLVFCLYTIAAYKGFGRRGAAASLAVITVFGAVAPSVTPLLVPGLFGTTAAAFVPIMTLFGPAAFVTYLWLSRTAPERTTARWFAERTPRPPRPASRPAAAGGPGRARDRRRRAAAGDGRRQRRAAARRARRRRRRPRRPPAGEVRRAWLCATWPSARGRSRSRSDRR